jgi:hypothetical protein
MQASEIVLNEVDQYIFEAIKTHVWSGFYTPGELQRIIDDLLEQGADEAWLRAAVLPEFERKAADEANWPAITDCNRLDAAFESLEEKRILALHNAGYAMSDGHEDAAAILEESGSHRYIGYCFYHGQDVERAISGGGLLIAFDHVYGEVPEKAGVGQAVQQALESQGLTTEWNGDAEMRINLPGFDWKRRGPTFL